VGWTEEFKVVLDQLNPPKGEVTRLVFPEEPGGQFTMPIEQCTTDINATEACGFDTGLGAPTQNPPTVELSLTTYEGDGWGLGPPFEGVEVCQTDTPNCTTSDANGQARLLLPANQEISYTMKKDGYMSWIAGDVTDETFGDEGRPGYPMFPDQQVEDFAAANGIPYPLTGGVTSHHMNPVSTAGVTYDLVDETARGYYVDDDPARNLRFDLTATTSDGFGGFWEVTPGEDHQVEFGGAATNCTVALAWPGDGPNRVKVPVKVGFWTLASMNCDVQ
jgi:hypothetical protein